MIKPCRPNALIANLQEISNYINIRKRISVITNIPRLVKIITLYFESLLYIDKNSVDPRKTLVKINNKTYKAMVMGHDSDGKEKELSFCDIFESILNDILVDFKKTLSKETLPLYLNTINEILETNILSPNYKSGILNAENKNLAEILPYLLIEIEEEAATKSVSIRKSLIFNLLKNKNNRDNFFIDKNLIVLYALNEFYANIQIKLFIGKNHFDKIFTFIYSQLDEFTLIPENIELDDNRIVNYLLTQLIVYNNLFQLESKSKLNEVFENYREYLDDVNSKKILKALELNLDNFTLENASIEIAKPDFTSKDQDKITTFLCFIVQRRIIPNKSLQFYSDEYDLAINKINCLFDDPIFKILDQIGISIELLPFSVFSDSVGNVSESIRIDIAIKEFYHPDFILDEKGIVDFRDFEEEKALYGRPFHPHKLRILKILRELKKRDLLPIEIELDEINIDFISNYYLAYFNEKGALIHHKIYNLTNLNSYLNFKNRFQTSLKTNNLTSEFLPLRDLILNTSISNEGELKLFLVNIINKTVKKSIEFRGLNRNLWLPDSNGQLIPIPEKLIQPIIYNLIKPITEIKGIQTNREVFAANGKLDILCSYLSNNGLIKVCIEIKNAHSSDIIHGIATQLPLYIKDEGNKSGIYLVIWYKCDSFNEPQKFHKIENLSDELIRSIPQQFEIDPLIIDACIKPPPSKINN